MPRSRTKKKTRAPAKQPPDTIAALVEKAKNDPTSLTPAELRHPLNLKKLKDAGELGGRYAAHREGMAVRSRTMSRTGRDIGPLPDVADPTRRARAMRSLRTFCETYFSERFKLAWSNNHKKILRKIQRAVLHSDLIALSMPRGSGKTSLIEVAALWAVLRGSHSYIAIIAAIRTKAIDILDSIKTELAGNDLLLADFPEVCYPIRCLENIHQRAKGQLLDGKPTEMTWRADRLILPSVRGSAASGAVIHSSGLTAAEIRGTKHTVRLEDGTTTTRRPSFAMIDDPQTDESAHSLTQNQTREGLIAGAVLGMAAPGRKIAAFMLCTVIAPGDMADHLLNRESHPDWQGERFKMVYAWPTNAKLWDRYASIRAEALRAERGLAPATEFYRKHRKAMDAGSKAAWPARFNEDELSAIQHAWNLRLRNEAAFFAEYQSEPVVEAQESAVMPADEIAAKLNGYPRGRIAQGTEIVTAFVDVQDKLLYWMVCAWTGDFSGFVVDYGTYPDQALRYFTLRTARKSLAVVKQGAGVEAAIFAGLETLATELLGRSWKGGARTEHQVDRLLVDAGGKRRDTIYDFCTTTQYQNVWPSHGRGITASRKPMADWQRKRGDRVGQHWRMPTLQRGESIRHVLVDTNWWKTFIHGRLAVARGDPGALTLFGREAPRHRLLSEHLVAERPIQVEGPYGTVDEWKLPPDKPDNHWLDCLVGCACAASIEGVELPGTGPSEARTRRRRKKVKLSEMKARA